MTLASPWMRLQAMSDDELVKFEKQMHSQVYPLSATARRTGRIFQGILTCIRRCSKTVGGRSPIWPRIPVALNTSNSEVVVSVPINVVIAELKSDD